MNVKNHSATLHTIRHLMGMLDQLEKDLTGNSHAEDANQIVQLKPEAHPTFGGALFRIRKARPGRLTGYLLVPHRAGMYLHIHAADVTPVGSLTWAEPSWGVQPYGGSSLLLKSLLQNGYHDIAERMCTCEIVLSKEPTI